MYRRKFEAREIDVLFALLRGVKLKNILFEDLPQYKKDEIKCLLTGADLIRSKDDFIILVNYFNIVQIGKNRLKSYGWDKILFSHLHAYLKFFDRRNISDHLFDLSYVGFTWEDLKEWNINDLVLKKIIELKPKLSDISVLLQTLECMGVDKSSEPLLLPILNDALEHINKNFDLFKNNKSASNVFFVLYRNSFRLNLYKYFSPEKIFYIQEFSKKCSRIKLREEAVKEERAAWPSKPVNVLKPLPKELLEQALTSQKNPFMPQFSYASTVSIVDYAQEQSEEGYTVKNKGLRSN